MMETHYMHVWECHNEPILLCIINPHCNRKGREEKRRLEKKNSKR